MPLVSAPPTWCLPATLHLTLRTSYAAVLQRLAALLRDTEAAEAYLAPRHVIDVLRDFAPAPAAGVGVPLGPAELLGGLRQLQPRLYSISSSQVWG